MKKSVILTLLALTSAPDLTRGEIIPDLKQLIIDYKELRKDWVFPDSSFLAVENAIKVIEAAKDHPPLLGAGSH